MFEWNLNGPLEYFLEEIKKIKENNKSIPEKKDGWNHTAQFTSTASCNCNSNYKSECTKRWALKLLSRGCSFIRKQIGKCRVSTIYNFAVTYLWNLLFFKQ